MNIVQMQNMLRLLIDHPDSPRYNRPQLDIVLNVAINDVVRDRYYNIKQLKKYSFQAIQRVRDELSTLVKNSSAITATGNYLPVGSFPIDYQYILQVWATIDSVEYRCKPTSYDEELDNKFKEPQVSEPHRVYWIENITGLEILFGDSGTLNSGRYWYLKIPDEVSSGIQRDSPYAFGATGTVICMSSTCVVDAVTYTVGEEIAVTAASNLTSGSVADGYTNSDLPESLHEEVSRRAAVILTKSSEDYGRAKATQQEENIS